MIPAPFQYLRPRSVDELVTVLANHGADAAILAGGQSLLTDLKVRRKTPGRVVDLAALSGLDGISSSPEATTVGAMARQTTIVSDPVVRQRFPLLVQVAHAAADPMVRRRGTLVGACCEVAPGGDWLAAALALEGTLLLEGPHGQREVLLTDFVLAPGTADLRPGEFARSLRIPAPTEGGVSVYRKVKHAAVGWNVAGAAVTMARVEDGHTGAVRIAVAGATAWPQRLEELETSLPRVDLRDDRQVGEVVEDALSTLEYQGDYYAPAVYRRKRLAVLLRRTLADLAEPGRR